jgi:hypothetical protein
MITLNRPRRATWIYRLEARKYLKYSLRWRKRMKAMRETAGS